MTIEQNIDARAPQAAQQKPKSNILLPLYVYPAPGAWDPLFGALSLYRDVNFTVIVNPNSGPGAPPWWPNTDYVRDVPKLNAQPNARSVGYVKIDYCRRPIADVFADITTYANWSKDSQFPGLGVRGIFFDETPNNFTAEVKRYLDDITDRVKTTDGILIRRSFITLERPSTQDLLSRVQMSQLWSKNPYNRTRSSYMVHSVPRGEVAALTYALRDRAEYLFVTDLSAAFYESFGPSWTDFVGAVAHNDDQYST